MLSIKAITLWEAVDERARRDDDEDERSGFSFTVSRWKKEGWLGG